MDDFMQVHRRIVSDYRIALGLTIGHARERVGLSLADVSDRTGIPEQTLRSYERGTYHPQVQRLMALAQVFNMTTFDLLIDTSEYIYRANGHPIPDRTSDTVDQLRWKTLLLYCGASPEDIDVPATTVGTKRKSNQ